MELGRKAYYCILPTTEERMITKRELMNALSRIKSADFDLADHQFYERGDRQFVNQVLAKNIAPAIETLEYLMELAD